MVRHQGGTFSNTRVDLDDQTYEGCTFERCTIVFAGRGPYKLSGCTFTDCQFVLDGAAALTVKYLADMHRLNAPFVLEVLKGIRTGQVSF